MRYEVCYDDHSLRSCLSDGFLFFYQDVLSRGILSGLVLFWNVYSVQPTPYNPQEVSVRLNLPKRLHVHN